MFWMLTTSSMFFNALYVFLGVWLTVRQLRVLNRLHLIVAKRTEEEVSGTWPITVRLAPYSAVVSTMLFAFGSVIQVAVYGLISLAILKEGHGVMTPSLLMVIHIRNYCFIGGAFASASHKESIYTVDGHNRRGDPPTRGKGNGVGRAAETWSAPSPARQRESQIHRLQSIIKGVRS